MTEPVALREKPEDRIRHELRGFPPEAVEAVLRLKAEPTAATLDAAARRVLEFYLPRERATPLDALPLETRLREDLGVDSLTMAEAAFKLDDLLGVALETREMETVHSLGDLSALLRQKLGI